MNTKKLIIFPTKIEAEAFLIKNNILKNQDNVYKTENYNILISGPGIPASMMNIICHLHNQRNYDLLILAGLAGAFNNELNTADVFCVESESFADLGVNNKGVFEPLYNYPEWSDQYNKGKIVNPNKALMDKTRLKKVTSNTVNLNNSGIKGVPSADTENMEGGAFFMIAERFGIPYLEIRAISNYVGERDKSNWRINEAVEKLAVYLTENLKSNL